MIRQHPNPAALDDECRWSGWPGAWCLDCGREDPREVALGDGTVSFGCRAASCTCANLDRMLECDHFGPVYETQLNLACTEPGSNRHNPYAETRVMTAENSTSPARDVVPEIIQHLTRWPRHDGGRRVTRTEAEIFVQLFRDVAEFDRRDDK